MAKKAVKGGAVAPLSAVKLLGFVSELEGATSQVRAELEAGMSSGSNTVVAGKKLCALFDAHRGLADALRDGSGGE